MDINIITKLKEKNLKVTPQRVSILKILNKGGHYTAEQVHTLIKREAPGISISTVYNTLDTLNSKGIINSLEVNGMKWYEAQLEDHVNVYCVDQDKIVDVPIDLSVIEIKLRERGFSPAKISVVAYSECGRKKPS